MGVLKPARLLPVPRLTTEATFMLTLEPGVNFPTHPTFKLFLLLLRLLLLSDLVDPGSLLECTLLRDVVGFLAQDERGDCLQ